MSISVVDLGKSFGGAVALTGVTLDAEDGEILAICGENGAGKSTLMGILAGAIPAGQYGGSMLLNGKAVAFAGPRDAERQGVAMLSQELLVFPELSVAENIAIGKSTSRQPWVSRRRQSLRARELGARVGLDVDVDDLMRTLAVSDQQLACIARALAGEPSVLILDEPTAVLARDAAERLFTVLRSLAAEGTTVLYVSHHLSEVTQLADRVAVLRNGRLVAGPTAGLSTRQIVEAMTGDVETTRVEPRRVDAGEAVLSIRIDDLQRARRTVLGPAELDVHRGEIVGVAGLAGSGRDDLIELLGGSNRHRLHGWVELHGARVDPRRAHDTRRKGLAFVPAERRKDGLMMLETMLANLLLGAEGRNSIGGIIRRPSRERQQGNLLAHLFGVKPADPSSRVAHLSGGNQQKVLIARTASRESSCLVLAEPTRGVDVKARASIHDRLRKTATDGAGILVSSSDTDELLTICDRIVVFHDGDCVAINRASELDARRLLHLVTAGGEETSGRRISRGGDSPPAAQHIPTKENNA